MPANGHQPEARFANTFGIGYNRSEFVIDAGQAFDNRDHYYLRIICSPTSAQELCRLLTESLEHYRGKFGPIPDQEDS